MKKWSGVFPATTTQFTQDERLDVAATQNVVAALIDDGIDGVICMGTVGENCSLSAAEKGTVMAAVRETAAHVSLARPMTHCESTFRTRSGCRVTRCTRSRRSHATPA